MQNLTISIITVAYNAQDTIEQCLDSVSRQKFKNIQHIVIDGGSTDNTVSLIKQYKDNIDVFISEPDQGIYDAMNKGIARATGDIIGTLNADDFLANDDVLTDVAEVFGRQNVNILYGNLDFIGPAGQVVRKWRSGKYRSGVKKLNWGWMPPHPTFYCKRSLFEELGYYKLDYGSAADYELMLRFFHTIQDDGEVYHLNKVVVKMLIGGVSNNNLRNRLKALRFDFKAMRNNRILFPYFTVIIKPLRKIVQFF